MQFISNIQHNQNQSEQIVIHNLATAPTSPIEGQMYQNTVDNIMYYYNGILWIPIRDKITFQLSVARNGTISSDQDLRRQNGTSTSNTPYILAFDCVLVAMAANTTRSGNNETWSAELFKNNTLEASLNIINNTKAYSMSYTNTFVAGDEIRFRANLGTSGDLIRPGITAWFREV